MKRWKFKVRKLPGVAEDNHVNRLCVCVLCVPAATRHHVTARAGFIGASAVTLSEHAVRRTQYAMRLNSMRLRRDKVVYTFDVIQALSYSESVERRLAVSCVCSVQRHKSTAQQLILQVAAQSSLEDHRL